MPIARPPIVVATKEMAWAIGTFAVLVVSCPCALSLATPAALAAATGALARRQIVAVRGDALETLAQVTHVVFDNQSLLSVGGFPTATATGSDLAGIARAAGIANARTVTDVAAFRAAAVEAIRGPELTCLVAKVEPVGPKSFHMDLHMLENRFEFQRALRPDPQGAPS